MEANNTSAVEFATKMRAHIALACADVERSTAFYSELFGQAPTKVREGYAKFEVAEPPLNLSLNFSPEPPRQVRPAHFGVQVKSTGEVMTKLAAMHRAGFEAVTEEAVGCCFAVQDKAWFADPDGNQWEVFVVTQADIPEHSRPSPNATPEVAETQAACCAPTCCQPKEAVA